MTKRKLTKNKGQALTEYALTLVLIAALTASVLQALGVEISVSLGNVSRVLDNGVEVTAHMENIREANQ